MSVEEGLVFPVYIQVQVLEEIKSLSSSSDLEIFGYLVGNVYKWKESTYVIIKSQLYIEDAVHSDKYSTSQIEGMAGKYEIAFQNLKKNSPNEELRIVGWWHSHPDFGCFLSSTDLQTQKYFFPESYQVALVVDPIREEFKFFTLDNTSTNEYRTASNAIISK